MSNRETDSNHGRVSLARALSKFGYCSRSAATRLIRAGRVSVNGRLRRSASTRVDMRMDQIHVDGKIVHQTQNHTYLMLNKPRGLVSSMHDEKGRETVYSCLEDSDLPRVIPVGRLDKASEGLLLFTNDTRWAARISDPETRIPKKYHVQVTPLPAQDLIERLQTGVHAGNDFLRIVSGTIIRSGTRNAWLELILDEGKNRHIRRLLSAFDMEVLRLIRVAIGPLILGDLSKGQYRILSPAEVEQLSGSIT